jgi:DNA-binding response OmpR family regulator
LPARCVLSRLGALGNVLILAREEVVAALLGLMVELSGFQPRFAEIGESAEDAIGDKSLHAVLVDCDHPEFSETLVETIRSSGARPVLFSPFRMHAEVSRVAARHGTKSFTLPTEPDVFANILGP